MKALKDILKFLLAVLMAVNMMSCGQKETSSSKNDGVSDMPGMKMEGKSMGHDNMKSSGATISLNDVIKPTNQYILSSLPLTTIHKQTKKVDLEFYALVDYNEKAAEVISARVSGRIDKLYLKYRFENISKGEKLMEIYSPELVTAEQDLLFLLANDAHNNSLIESAKQKLILLGVSDVQLKELIKNKKASSSITIYSNYSGHIHQSGDKSTMNNVEPVMNQSSQITEPLSLKEGMYVEKGQSLFMIYNTDDAWVLASIFPDQQPYIHKGDTIQIISCVDSTIKLKGKVDFIEPEYRQGSKTLNVRINFNNSSLKLPIGSQVKVKKKVNISGSWLPSSSIVSLGNTKAVFVKSGGGFIARKIEVKYSAPDKTLVRDDLPVNDSLALNAHYLIDSESFIKVKQ